MSIGPIEYLVLGFHDGAMSDDIANELVKLISRDAVRLLDIVVVTCDSLGALSWTEADELIALAPLDEFDVEIGGLIGPEDIDFIGEHINPGGAVAIILLEDLWAASLANALDRSGGILIEGARIPKVLAESAMATLAVI
jgi:hypothetical protein